MTRTNSIYIIETRMRDSRMHWFPDPGLTYQEVFSEALRVARKARERDGNVYEYRVVKYAATVSKEPKSK